MLVTIIYLIEQRFEVHKNQLCIRVDKLPREVWIPSFSSTRVEADNHGEMVEKVLLFMEEIVNYKPDVICLPEIFPFFHISERVSVPDVAELPLGKITS